MFYALSSFSLFTYIVRYSTEYIDEKIEFMFEDLDISSIGLLAGHVFIQNITDLEIDAPKVGKSTAAVGAFTHLQVKGLQLKLNQLSFY